MSCGDLDFEEEGGIETSFTSNLGSGGINLAGYSLDNIPICYPNGKCTNKQCFKTIWEKYCVCYCYCGTSCYNVDITLWPSIAINCSCQVPMTIDAVESYDFADGFSTPLTTVTLNFIGNLTWSVGGVNIFNLNLSSIPTLVISNGQTYTYKLYSGGFTYDYEGLDNSCSFTITGVLCPTNFAVPLSIDVACEISQSYDGVGYEGTGTFTIPISFPA